MLRSFGKTARPLRLGRRLQKITWCGIAVPLFVACTLSLFAGAKAAHDGEPPAAKPEVRIPVDVLGYRPPGSLYLLSRMSFSSLDFVDSHHVLFTFHQSQLLRRAADATSSDDDEMIRAVVLALPDGQVFATADWRMHDRTRYLWPLSDGRFLVRQRNTYSITDSSLQLHGFVTSPTPVRTTEVSPDGHLLVVEREFERHTPEEHAKLEQESNRFGDTPPPEDTEIDLLNLDTRTVLKRMRVELPIVLPVAASGFLAVQQGKRADDYVMEYFPFNGNQVTLGTVASTCKPRETFLNATALMIESCGQNNSEVFIDTWTTDGKKLWQGRRDGRAVWPTFATSRNGNRFAIGLLQVSHSIDLADSLTDSDVKRQLVQVFDTNTGTLLLTTYASPVLTAGQNFALSPEGDRLAVLRDGAIEIFRVPAAPLSAPSK
jgi:hypothetical protein